MEIAIAIALVISHLATLGAGGYLHYRFGNRVVSMTKALKDLPK